MHNDDTTQTPDQPSTPTAVEQAPRRRRLLLPIGIAAAALGLIAATAGITAVALDEHDDGDDDRRAAVITPRDTRADRDAELPTGSRSAPTADVESFEAARDAAVDAAGGGALLELDRERDGWTAEVLLTDGTTVDVRLDDSLSALGVGTPDADDDPAPAGSLADGALARAIEAAVDAAGSGAATAVHLEDDADAYRVDVVATDGAQFEVRLDAAFAVTGVELDD